MSTDHDTAMAELRRVCSGDRGPDVLPQPVIEDLWTGLPMAPRYTGGGDYSGRGLRTTGVDGGSVGGGGHTDNPNKASRNPIGSPGNDPWPEVSRTARDWGYVAVVCMWAATAGLAVYFWMHP